MILYDIAVKYSTSYTQKTQSHNSCLHFHTPDCIHSVHVALPSAIVIAVDELCTLIINKVTETNPGFLFISKLQPLQSITAPYHTPTGNTCEGTHPPHRK
jgi:hypothetical protein